MTTVFLLEPEPGPEWFPFWDCRPIAELRAGAWLIRERWEAIADGETGAIFGPSHLHTFVEDGVPAVKPRETVRGPAIIGTSTFAPTGVHPVLPNKPARLMNDANIVGWWVPGSASWDGDDDAWPEVEIEGVSLHGTYDLVTALELLLAGDTLDFTHEGGDPLPQGSIVIGEPSDVVILGGTVEPGVTFDVREGPVVVEQHAHVKSGTRFEGPVYVGPGSEILGGSIGTSSIGPRCKVRGEVSHVAFLGYANKAHEGFVGHSVIGRWVNLGAGTTTSNLKNTYGEVKLRIGDHEIETGRQLLGALVGDHAKTAIGTLFNTGATVGTGANVFGFHDPPRFVPPLAWGASNQRVERDGFLKIASRVMPRRKVEFTEAIRVMLGTLYDHATSG